MLSLSRWRPRHLAFAWIAYWIALLLVSLGPAITAALPVIGDEKGHGSISASFGSAGFSLSVLCGSTAVWRGEASLLSIALWVAGPPLLLWVAWMWRRARETASPPARGVASSPRAQ
jgi:hypothetical protein